MQIVVLWHKTLRGSQVVLWHKTHVKCKLLSYGMTLRDKVVLWHKTHVKCKLLSYGIRQFIHAFLNYSYV